MILVVVRYDLETVATLKSLPEFSHFLFFYWNWLFINLLVQSFFTALKYALCLTVSMYVGLYVCACVCMCMCVCVYVRVRTNLLRINHVQHGANSFPAKLKTTRQIAGHSARNKSSYSSHLRWEIIGVRNEGRLRLEIIQSKVSMLIIK